MRYNTYGLLSLAAGVFNISTGLLILLKNPRSSINRRFFYVTLASFLWIASYGMMSLVSNPRYAAFWFSIAFLGVPFIPYAIFLFSERLRGRQNKFAAVSGFLLCFFLSATGTLWPEKICEIRDWGWGRFNYFRDDSFGWTHFSLLISTFALFLIMAAHHFYRNWKEASAPQERKRLRNIFLAFLISYVGTIDFAVAKGLDIYPIGFAALTVLIGIIAYTIIRHQFFEINVMIKRASMLVLIYSFLLAFSFPMAAILLRRYLADLSGSQMGVLLVIMSGFSAILSLGPFIYAYLVQHNFWLRGNLSRGLAHELKSPLGIIQSASDVISEELAGKKADKDKLQHYSQMIKENASRLESFVGDLLSVARTENSDFSINRALVDVVNLTQEVVVSFRPIFTEKKLRVNLNSPKEMIANIDAHKWKQIVSNLLSNAIKFSDTGSIVIDLRSTTEELVFSIQDEGRGIAPNHLAHVFNRFYQADPGSKGSGIGLSIAKAWVEAHGGKIWAESDGEGRGTKVTFTVPAYV